MKPTRRHYVPPLAFRVVQPYGRDKAREATMVSEHATAVEAFAELTACERRWPEWVCRLIR